MQWKIPLYKIYWDEEDINSVSKVIRRGMYWANGPEIVKFERKISEMLNVAHTVAVNSGTSALHLALLSLGIGPGDEVIVPAFTFIATANSVLFTGAKPIFADIESDTLGIDPKILEEYITEKTKAILPIHYGGIPNNIHEIQKIAKEYGLHLVEDAAESFLAKSKNKFVGTIGDVGVFSFCQTKVFTTGEGGAIVTNSRELYEKLKLYRSHGRAESKDYFSSAELMNYISLGYNYRMPTMIAALGLSQLSKVKYMISRRKEIANRYREALEKLDIYIPKGLPGDTCVHQMFSFLVKDRRTRDKLQKHLISKGIMTKVYFNPVYKTKFYRSMGYQIHLPVTEDIADRILTIPLYPSLTDNEVEYIITSIKEYFNKG